ncbi:MAG TPA: alpha/beta fold hydrolase [Phycisphaerae bacterium]|nr:alpha/beta fold hydrolase [Phycisphaerae bacterium]
MKRMLPSVCLLLAACSTSVSADLPAARSVNSMTVHEVKRSYILRFPKKYDGKAKLPLVMLLNGANDSAAYAEAAYHFDEKAEKENFVLVIPDALGEFHVWNSHGDSDAAKDDIAFLTKLLETLPKDYAIDPKRVYIAGHSAGAMMTYRMAGERSDLVAAIGIVAGVVDSDFPAPKQPVPLIAFHGKEDTVLEYPYLAEALKFWGKADKCTDPPKEERVNEHVTRQVFKPAAGGADMVAYTLERGNHMWAGGNIMPGKTMEPVQDLPATDVMWDFFKAHPKK